MAKSLESWEREDLGATINILVEAIRRSLPAGRVDVKGFGAMPNAIHNLDLFGHRLGDRGPAEVLELCERLDDLRERSSFEPALWDREVGEIIKALVDLQETIAPKQCDPASLAPLLTANQNRLLSYLWECGTASFSDLIDDVWTTPVADDSVEKAIRRLNGRLAELEIPVSVQISNAHAILDRPV